MTQFKLPERAPLTALLSAALTSLTLLVMACTPLPPRNAGPAGVDGEDQAHQIRVTELPPESAAPLPATDPEVLLKVLAAEAALHREEYDQAAVYYGEAAMRSEDPEIAERATRVALYAGQARTARDVVQRWLDLQPDAYQAHLAAARLYLIEGDHQQALPHLTRVINDAQDSHAAWQSVNQMLASSGQGEQAIDVMSELIEATGNEQNTDVIRLQGQLSAQLGDVMFALVLADREIALRPQADAYAWRGRLNLVAGNEAAALDDLAEAVRISPDDRNLRLQYAGLLQQAEQYDVAQAQLSRLPVQASVLFTRAVYALGAGNHGLAEDLYNQMALLEDGQANHRYFLLGQISELMQRDDVARSWYRQVLPGDDYAEARMRLAVLLGDADRLDEAREVLAPLRHALPQIAVDAFLLEAQLLQQADLVAESLEILNRALALFPEDVDLLYGRAIAAEGVDRLDLAERDLRKIIAMQPDNATALNALGYTLADRTDRYEEALALISQALAISPDEAAIVDSMGWVKFRLGELEQAEQFLRRALEMTFDGEIAAHLGEVLWAQERQDEALELWREALETMPDDDTLLETMDRLSPD